MAEKLEKLIIDRIANAGRLTFAEFMRMVLYYPGEGYYTGNSALIGARGDFYTAPHLTPVFGQLIARQLAEMWERLGQPSPFTLVELGAGQGLLTSDVLSWFYQQRPDIWPHLEYRIVEISEALQFVQGRRLTAVPNAAELLKKARWETLNDFAPESVTGCFFSNELFDALPVHRVLINSGELQEIYVNYDREQGQFVEETGTPSTPALTDYFKRLKLDLSTYPDGYRTEICLQAAPLLEQLSRSLQRGYILTIDYGYTAERRYHPRRTDGTLQCYYKHQVNYNPYQHIGEQDITAHVDFTTLMQAGAASGLQNLGFITQAAFLGGLGIGERMAELSAPGFGEQSGLSPNEIIREREALHKLINPNVLGNFGVLVQGKAVAQEPPLLGLQFAF